MSDREVRQRIVAVTGAGNGIGAAICRKLAAPGICLVMHTRANRDAVEAVAEEARAAGAETEIILGDLIEEATANNVIAAARARFGGLDHFVSNAGFTNRDAFGQLTPDILLRSVQAMTGAFLSLSTAALPLLEKSQHGRVVAVTGLAAHSY